MRLRKLLSILVVIPLLSLTVGSCAGQLLSMQITSPSYTTKKITEGVVTVSGTVSDPKATVTVNGVKIGTASDGTFSTNFELAYGKNTITVKAELEKQKPVTKTITLTRILTIDLASPQDGAEVTENVVTVTGTVSDPAARVVVNNIEVEMAEDGTFSTDVELDYGENSIVIAAMVEGLEPVTKAVTLSRILGVQIASPQNRAQITESPITVSGTVSNPKATLMVNGIEVEVAEDGSFSVQIELKEGENTIVVTATAPVTKSVTVTYTPAE